MSRRISLSIPALLLAALCAGHVVAADDETALTAKLTRLGYAPGASVEKIQGYKLDGWNYLDSKHIMIYTGPSERYLIGLMNTCHDLSTAENIAFSTTVSQLTKFDKLIVQGAGGMRQDCPITEIRELKSTKKQD